MTDLRVYYGTLSLPYVQYTPICKFIGNEVFDLSLIAYWNLRMENGIRFDILPTRVTEMTLSVDLPKHCKERLVYSIIHNLKHDIVLYRHGLELTYYPSIHDDVHTYMIRSLDDLVVDLYGQDVEKLKEIAAQFGEDLIPKTHSVLDELLMNIANTRFRNKKAMIIQKAWKIAITCPTMNLCRQRLLREFDELMC